MIPAMVGLFTGMTILSVLYDIIFFDIPFTLKLKRTNFINVRPIIGGSSVSLMFWGLILAGVYLLVVFLFKEELKWFLFSAVVGIIWEVVRKKRKARLMELYFQKHIQNISPTLKIALYNKQGFDYEGIKKYLNMFLKFDGKNIK